MFDAVCLFHPCHRNTSVWIQEPRFLFNPKVKHWSQEVIALVHSLLVSSRDTKKRNKNAHKHEHLFAGADKNVAFVGPGGVGAIRCSLVLWVQAIRYALNMKGANEKICVCLLRIPLSLMGYKMDRRRLWRTFIGGKHSTDLAKYSSSRKGST